MPPSSDSTADPPAKRRGATKRKEPPTAVDPDPAVNAPPPKDAASTTADVDLMPLPGTTPEGEDVVIITCCKGVEFNATHKEFIVDHVPAPMIGCPFDVYHWKDVERYLRYDERIRGGLASVDEPVPIGYYSLRSTLRKLVDPSVASLSGFDDKGTAEVEGEPMRPIFFRPEVQEVLGGHAAKRAARSKSAKEGQEKAEGTQAKKIKKQSVDDHAGSNQGSHKVPGSSGSSLGALGVDEDIIQFAIAQALRGQMRAQQRRRERELEKGSRRGA
ncbi:hypothetical protein PUNSTDRAFT_130454 [Punctularia strigosozonata HHB-11173 SS5]|uniref:uncharacterized protein n=1 Tax=Punctularia strigosozonata (strain HHB-11173) TaxID=741275 RepID=UPI00044165BA|nr:uncharacterized protein PUNSTDRAFT_130454 [Punctularia strigosozonata HHB-11173 SS5]EIN12185.1 hypothetical protein PUNSTDRAFT_130454 [Punctularia strigosozonata HHB-11173 SS5]